ncbi:hypothetical protein ASPBRDRAFT_39855 [Aspergillus brasiliensis CBS 101740]|uniref:Uncharacterized protein n=1 Tax=Aspergillus brasiliensis (strain CBS 101740 / IMI 381727 / IBT 21946) TaxID=767769 RepID=A0A1L9USL2_ASPBC|nr:hypothetical protein ASPBRDRAFT_39855 [Aspergillus brasiliensis CBS 101740]
MAHEDGQQECSSYWPVGLRITRGSGRISRRLSFPFRLRQPQCKDPSNSQSILLALTSTSFGLCIVDLPPPPGSLSPVLPLSRQCSLPPGKSVTTSPYHSLSCPCGLPVLLLVVGFTPVLETSQQHDGLAGERPAVLLATN